MHWKSRCRCISDKTTSDIAYSCILKRKIRPHTWRAGWFVNMSSLEGKSQWLIDLWNDKIALTLFQSWRSTRKMLVYVHWRCRRSNSYQNPRSLQNNVRVGRIKCEDYYWPTTSTKLGFGSCWDASTDRFRFSEIHRGSSNWSQFTSGDQMPIRCNEFRRSKLSNMPD